MMVLWVVAETLPGCKDPEGARGVWEIEFKSDLPPDIAIGAALDTFHGKVCISVLDDFEVSVFDPEILREVHEDEKYEQGSHEGSLNGRLARDLNELLRDRKPRLIAALKKAPANSEASPLHLGDIRLWRKHGRFWTQMDGGGVQCSHTPERAVEKALTLLRRRWKTSV